MKKREEQTKLLERTTRLMLYRHLDGWRRVAFEAKATRALCMRDEQIATLSRSLRAVAASVTDPGGTSTSAAEAAAAAVAVADAVVALPPMPTMAAAAEAPNGGAERPRARKGDAATDGGEGEINVVRMTRTSRDTNPPPAAPSSSSKSGGDGRLSHHSSQGGGKSPSREDGGKHSPLRRGFSRDSPLSGSSNHLAEGMVLFERGKHVEGSRGGTASSATGTTPNVGSDHTGTRLRNDGRGERGGSSSSATTAAAAARAEAAERASPGGLYERGIKQRLKREAAISRRRREREAAELASCTFAPMRLIDKDGREGKLEEPSPTPSRTRGSGNGHGGAKDSPAVSPDRHRVKSSELAERAAERAVAAEKAAGQAAHRDTRSNVGTDRSDETIIANSAALFPGGLSSPVGPLPRPYEIEPGEGVMRNHSGTDGDGGSSISGGPSPAKEGDHTKREGTGLSIGSIMSALPKALDSYRESYRERRNSRSRDAKSARQEAAVAAGVYAGASAGGATATAGGSFGVVSGVGGAGGVGSAIATHPTSLTGSMNAAHPHSLRNPFDEGAAYAPNATADMASGRMPIEAVRIREKEVLPTSTSSSSPTPPHYAAPATDGYAPTSLFAPSHAEHDQGARAWHEPSLSSDAVDEAVKGALQAVADPELQVL